MVFSSLPLYHLDPPPNWPHQQLDRQLEEVIHGENSQVPPPPLPPPLPPPPPTVSDTSGGDKGLKKPGSMADRARLAKITQPEASLKCPRCESTNTKFCYYNNYNLSQPRHFCKTCRRYWTRGGALRNVPVGGGCRRKNKRTKGNNSKKSPNKASSSSTSGHHLLSSPPLLFPPPSSYSDYDLVFGATNIKDAGFQIACSHNNNIIEQWKLPCLVQHHQQFPSTFFSNLEVPSSSEGLYNGEIDPSMTTLLYSGNTGSDHHHVQLSTTVKMEGDMDQVVGISKSLKGNSENNERFWEANNNGSAWDINNNNVY